MRQDTAKAKYVFSVIGLNSKNNATERWNMTIENDYPTIDVIRNLISEKYLDNQSELLIYAFNEDDSAYVFYKDSEQNKCEELLKGAALKSFSKDHSNSNFVCFVYRTEAKDTFECVTWK